MEAVVVWASFIGAWFLVAGPLFQGSVELHRIESSIAHDESALPSRYWWLFPPAMYVITRRRIAADPSVGSRARLFRASGTGWFTVAVGGALIATQETWELVRLLHGGTAVFWVVYLALLVASTLNTSIRMIRERVVAASGD